MMNNKVGNTFGFRAMLSACCLLLFLVGSFSASAQRRRNIVSVEAPPRPISIFVSPGQGLNFGAFVNGGSGGTVIISSSGSRSVTGSLIQISQGVSFSPAIFQVDANPGTLITIVNGPDISMNGSNGGSMSMHIGSANLGSPFISTAISPSRTLVQIGGTLTVGTPLANPPGNYNGTFSVTFIQQ